MSDYQDDRKVLNPNSLFQKAENKRTKYGHFIPFVVVHPYEIERVCPADWCHLQDSVPLVEGRERGTVVVRDPLPKSATGVALYVRVSSVDQKNELERRMERLKDYSAAHGSQVNRMKPRQGWFPNPGSDADQ